ncbi:MAG TPA: SO2930 family diheme c-type cytochrome [Kofleriaceae bacterium]|nr:SO2930 family diheme c-type cytochrome [Kofleriaceae bacterium]
MKLLLAMALGVAACGGGGGDTPPDADPDAEVCAIADGDGVSWDWTQPFCTKLSSYRFLSFDGTTQTPSDGVVPFDLNTPLFSDYAFKWRYLYLPPGTSMTYDDTVTFDMPVGAAILKTFWYAADAREPTVGVRQIETRLLAHREDGWKGITYLWNDEQTEAYAAVAGATVPVSWIDTAGDEQSTSFMVPNANQCKQCHEEEQDVMRPVGPKARHLNRDHDYGAGAENILTHLADIGYLTGAPADPSTAPRTPVFDDEATGTIEERARGWLDINCAHCHNPTGPARTSGLDLRAAQTDPYSYGICKTPVAAGLGSCGLQYDIVPGMPDQSILVCRIESVEAGVRMPELGRTLVHAEGVAVIRSWIESMAADPCL